MSASQIAVVPNSPILPARTAEQRLAFVPRDFDDAWRQADVLAKSGIIPDYLRGKPHDVLATIVTGAELGLSPMQSMRDIVVVKGRGFIQAKLMVALVKQACRGDEYFKLVSSSGTSAVYETKRNPEGTTRYEYTIEMAKQAGLADQDNYRKRPAEMLRARASHGLCEIVWSDITRGIGNKDDVEGSVNSAPATYAPPPPDIEEAQLASPTPPPPTAKEVKQVFEQGKTAESTGQPVTLREADFTGTETIRPTPAREPGSDDGDEAPPPKPEEPKQQTLAVEPPSDLAIFAAVKNVDVNDPSAEKQLDDLSPKARSVQGPIRNEISAMMVEKRRAIGKLKAGK